MCAWTDPELMAYTKSAGRPLMIQSTRDGLGTTFFKAVTQPWKSCSLQSIQKWK